MSLAYAYNGSNLAYRVAPTSLEVPSLADHGEAAMGGVDFEDPTAALTLVGHRPFTIEETDCTQPRLFTGYTTERAIGRLPEQGLLAGPDARVHDMTIVDLNAVFGFGIIHGADGNRPVETWSERLTWLLGAPPTGSGLLTGLIEDTGYVTTNTRPMDAVDYRGGKPSAVLDDLCERTGPGIKPYNYFAFWDPAANGGAGAAALFFDLLDATTNNSTLSISNDLADTDALTFRPDPAARLTRGPDQTYSEVIVEYRHGRAYRSRATTAATYIQRGTSISRPYTGLASTARDQAEQFLDQHGNEQDKITCTINVPSTAAGLVTAGQRMNVKFTHMPGYDTWQSMRVVACTPKPCDNTGARYDIALELLSPRPASSEEGPCEDTTPSGTYPRLGSGTSDATGNVMYLCSTVGVWPTVPTPYKVGGWHFPAYGGAKCGGGAVDYAGDHVENVVRCVVVGAGTISIPTWPYGCEPDHYCDMIAVLRHELGGIGIDDETQTGVVGDTFTFVVPDDGFCTHWVDVSDACNIGGSKWGFDGMTWVLGETDVQEDLGPPPGTTILSETPTPAPDGTTVLSTLANGYLAGSLLVYVDGIPIPSSEVTETDPAAGTFTLSWAPDADEHITVLYITA